MLVVYSALVKRWSGFAANMLVGLLVGTAFLYGEATVSGTISLVSLSLYPIFLGTVGGNILRDILSSEGDSRVGYPTLPQKIGNRGSVSIAAIFFVLTAVLAPLPYFLGFFGRYYVALILSWGILPHLRFRSLDSLIRHYRKRETLRTTNHHVHAPAHILADC